MIHKHVRGEPMRPAELSCAQAEIGFLAVTDAERGRIEFSDCLETVMTDVQAEADAHWNLSRGAPVRLGSESADGGRFVSVNGAAKSARVARNRTVITEGRDGTYARFVVGGIAQTLQPALEDQSVGIQQHDVLVGIHRESPVDRADEAEIALIAQQRDAARGQEVIEGGHERGVRTRIVDDHRSRPCTDGGQYAVNARQRFRAVAVNRDDDGRWALGAARARHSRFVRADSPRANRGSRARCCVIRTARGQQVRGVRQRLPAPIGKLRLYTDAVAPQTPAAQIHPEWPAISRKGHAAGFRKNDVSVLILEAQPHRVAQGTSRFLPIPICVPITVSAPVEGKIRGKPLATPQQWHAVTQYVERSPRPSPSGQGS